jgi:L-asparaginase II
MPPRSTPLARESEAPELEASSGANPVLLRVLRGDHAESRHRGCWVLADGSGQVLASGGAVHDPVYVRSTIKSLQAMPLIESGAADRFAFDSADLALALASHDGEAMHTERVARTLARLECSSGDLLCGAHPPTSREAREDLRRRGETPSALHNNCSGKHAGFLALSRHLGEVPRAYLDPAGEVQQRVRRAVTETTGVEERQLTQAVDGCSAPPFRMPLVDLATAFARVSDPEGSRAFSPERRTACERMLAAAGAHPELVAGTKKRLCTDLLRASAGRLFPKIGGESVYVVGIRGAGRALALKIDDGTQRALAPVILALLEKFGFLSVAECDSLKAWTDPLQRNWAGLEIGRVEVEL